MTGHTRLVVSADDVGTRLDQYLATHLDSVSRSQVQRLMRENRVTLSAGEVKPGLAVPEGLEIDVDVPPPLPATPSAEALPLSILYDDTDLVVIDKPAGMVVHPAPGHATGTLVNALLHHVDDLSGIGGAERPGIVHRLDRGTSGVMVVAKNDRAHRAISSQFHDRLVRKEYVALVWGAPAVGLRIEDPIGRDPNHRQRMSGRARRGRTALTEVIHVEALRGVSLVRVMIGTGRTHQIRVHLSEHGFPLVGDGLYNGLRKRLPTHLAAIARLTRPFLHAAHLAFTHPADGRQMTFDAPLPDDLHATITALRHTAARR
ncbi:MAG: RluA family pseudouridine synthase [Acidobacteria bacterium]|nr:RluA family pseudouridine synthase [Acidobacteriota bacterium]